MTRQLKLATKPWRAIVDEVTLSLPMPPSVNNLFFEIPYRGRAPSKQYQDWKHVAGLEICRQRSGRVDGQVEIAFVFEEQRTVNGKLRVTDLDGRIKAPTDLLVSMGVIEADDASVVRKITAEWSREVVGARVTVRKA